MMFSESNTGRVYFNMYEANAVLEGLELLKMISHKDKDKLELIETIREKIRNSYLGEIIEGVEE